ncbi:hypothetical protein Q0M94_00800 [Deinococcus radiomollis]|uniref:hypothetical protein n=1 Tax=Deinococcus radiomollis TaxID=468916 RepID=UPI003892898D
MNPSLPRPLYRAGRLFRAGRPLRVFSLRHAAPRSTPFLARLTVILAVLLAALLPSTARAGSCQGVACVTAGPRLAQVDSTQGPLLNALLGGLTGSSVNLNVADWNGLNSSNIDLGLFLNALQARTSTGSTTAALNATATLAQFLGAAADAAQQSGDLAAVSAIGALTGSLNASALNQTARIGDFLKLGFNQGAFNGSKLNLLNLVTGGVQLFNSQNTLTTANTPISLGAVNVDLSALGIAGLGATTPTVTLYAQVTEPPILICGPAGTQFYTASIRVKLNVALNGLNNLGLAGVAGASLQLTNLKLYLDIARAQGTIGTINAVGRSLSLTATPGLVNLYLGDIPDSTFFNRSHILTPADLGYAKIGTVAAGVSVLGINVPVNLDVNAKASGNGSYPLGTLSFTGPYPQSQKVGSSSAAVPVLVDDLLQNLNLNLSVSAGQNLSAAALALVGPLVNTLLVPVKTLSGNIIRPVAVAALRATVDRLLYLLGIGIGQAEVSVLGVNNSCLLAGNVYRDLEPDGVRGGSEIWSGPQLYATQLTGAAATQTASVPTGSGAFSFQVGEGTFVVLLNPAASATTPASPAGYLFVNPQTGSASATVTAGSASIPDLPYGLFFGDRVSGKTYRDDGRGGGVPNNARQESGEPSLSGVPVALTGSGGTRSTSTDAQGNYTLYLPGDWTGNSLSTGSGPLVGSVTGVYNGSAVTLAGNIGGAGVRPYPLPNPSGAARQADFGLVQNLALSAAPPQSSEAPATLRYTHSLKPGTQGTLALSAVSGYSTQIYLDTNCDGVVDASERATPSSSVTVGASWPRDASGDLNACALELNVTLPAGTAPGTVDNALLSAGLTWTGNAAVQDAAAVTDTSTVVPGTVLSKKVANLTRTPANTPVTESDTADAFPKDVLRYCLTASNTGPQTATLLVIQDTLKPLVVYQVGSLTLGGVPLSDAADTDAGEVVGRDVTVRVPALASGAQTKVCFQVQVP